MSFVGNMEASEDRVLCARAVELCKRSDTSPTATPFLSPRRQRMVFEELCKFKKTDNLFFWGGYKEAQRRMAIFLPPWLVPETDCPYGIFDSEREEHFFSHLENLSCLDILKDFIVALELSGSGYNELSHRDWLGSLMGLGIKRDVLGDIAVENGHLAYLFADIKTADFIESELSKAGRDTVLAKKLDLCQLPKMPEKRYENISTTVASARLDGIVRALCNLSREDAQSLVLSGEAELNYFVEKACDRTVSAGDTVTIHGYGKFVIDGCTDVTRRGRLRLAARKYI